MQSGTASVFLVVAVAAAGWSAIPVNASALRTVSSKLPVAPRAAPAPTWRLAATPSIAIGGENGVGPTEFAGVAGVVRLPNGRIVVADAGTTQLRVFGPEGRYVETIARRGLGPGEMRGVDGLFYSSDSLYARDSFGGVHVFSSTGAYARSVRFVLGGRRAFGVSAQGVMANSALIGVRSARDPRARRAGTDSAEIRRLSGNGVGVNILVRSPAYVTYRLADGRTGVTAFSPSLELVAFPREACFAYTAQFVISCVDSVGMPTRTIRAVARPRAVTDAMTRAWRDASSGRLPDGSSRYVGSLREHRERVARDAGIAERLPVIGRLLAAQTGDLWVSDYQPSDGIPSGTGDAPGAPAGATTWRIFSPANALRATLVTPPGFRVFDEGAGWVLGVARDEDDLETVELWRIEAHQGRQRRSMDSCALCWVHCCSRASRARRGRSTLTSQMQVQHRHRSPPPMAT